MNEHPSDATATEWKHCLDSLPNMLVERQTDTAWLMEDVFAGNLAHSSASVSAIDSTDSVLANMFAAKLAPCEVINIANYFSINYRKAHIYLNLGITIDF